MPTDWAYVTDLDNESFSRLINISGRLRMLSQRITMFILFCQLNSRDELRRHQEYLERLNDTIIEFEVNFTNIINGNKDKGIPKLPSAKIEHALVEQGTKPLVSRFISICKDFRNQLNSGKTIDNQALAQLVDIAVLDVLPKLDELTHLFEEEFHDYSDFMREEIRKQKRNVLEAIKSIKKIARQTDMVSINSLIIASKGGEIGKQFKVVADRLQSLNGMIEKSSDDIVRYFEVIMKGD